MEFPICSYMGDMKKSGVIDGYSAGFIYKSVVIFPPISEIVTSRELVDVLRQFCREFYGQMFLIEMLYKLPKFLFSMFQKKKDVIYVRPPQVWLSVLFHLKILMFDLC